ncbi:MAG: diaminopimelate epimerase [Candidatus Thiodiazotropha taylori]|nr:diaminopimelate epimerase [Candidatus Thiodiazotropha taylori]
MILNFTKMHGLGNDFVVIDAVNQQFTLNEDICRHFADRRFGIGCDQILLVEPAKLPETDFHFRIFNADGSEAGACGNGARCFAQFIRRKGLSNLESVRVGTSTAVIILRYLEDNQIEVDMGEPSFDPATIPFVADQQADQYPLQINGEQYTICAVSMGNPHAVLMVGDTDLAPVERLGPLIERHERFPQRTNVGFLQVVSPSEVKLRVFERGSGETLACGSGACAAVAAGRLIGLLEEEVVVHLRGGDLVIKWSEQGSTILMRGPAETVYEGAIEI